METMTPGGRPYEVEMSSSAHSNVSDIVVKNPSAAWHVRYSALCTTNWPFLPRQEGARPFDDGFAVSEELIAGVVWDELNLSASRTRELGAELFDALEILHQADLFCGPLRSDQVLLDRSSRLRLLGLSAHDPSLDPSDPKRRDLDYAVQLLHALELSEREELGHLSTAQDVSRALRGQVHRYEYAEPPFLGRKRAWQLLDQALGQTHLLTLEGLAGEGKTRLLREWSAQSGARILWAKAEREVAPSPYSMFVDPLSTLEEELLHRPDLVTTLVHSLGVELPLLESLQGRRQRTAGLQYGTLVMLGLTLAVFGKDRPTVLVLDDCQWADPLTLRFLEYWAGHGEAMLVIASFRSDEINSQDCLRSFDAPHISLGPLKADLAHQLILSCHPCASQTLCESAIRAAQGNPYSLLCYLRTGMLPGELSTDRLNRIPPQLRRALELGSVIGRQFSLRTVEGCLRQPVDLQLAFDEGYLRRPSHEPTFAHDRIRDLILSSLHSDQLASLHLQVARYLATQDEARPYEVAYHFQAAGASIEGFEFSRRAAFEARDAHALTVAIFYLQAALAGCANSSRADQHALWSELGDCQRLTGSYDEALLAFREALALAPTQESKAKHLWSLGDVYFKHGELQKARDALLDGLLLLGAQPGSWVLLDFLRQAAIQVFRTYFPIKSEGLRSESSGAKELLCADFYNRLAYTQWFLDGPIPSIRAHLRELNLAQRFVPTRTLARAQASHAIAMSTFPLWNRALRFGQIAMVTAHNLGDDWGEGQASHFYGAVLLGSTRFEEAKTVLKGAVRKLGLTGDRWEENGARYHLALVHLRLGDLDQAVALARDTHEVGVRLQDRLAAGDNLFTWARASYGRLPREVLEKEKTFFNPDIQRAAELRGAEGMICLREGLYLQAEEHFLEAIAIYRRRRASTPYSAPLPSWLLTSQRLLAQHAEKHLRPRALRKALRTAQTALRTASRYRENLPHALREKALLLRLQNKMSAASDKLTESLVAAEMLGMKEELTLGLALRSRWESQNALVTDGFDWLFGLDPKTIRSESR